MTDLVITKADVLSAVDEIHVCETYQTAEGDIDQVPFELETIKGLNYKIFKGWGDDITDVRSKSDLPAELRQYLEYLETALEVPITYVSVGPGREQIMEGHAVGKL